MNRSTKRTLVYLAVVVSVIVAADLTLLFHWWPLVRDNSTTFGLSLLASLVEDTAFFIVVGIAVLLLTSRDPSNEALDTKLDFLFPEQRTSLAFRSYAATELQRLAGLCSRGEQFARVEAYDPTLGAFKIHFTYRYQLENLFGAHEYRDHFEAFVSPDQFPRAIERPAVLGQVLQLDFTPHGEPPERHLLHPVDVVDADFDHPVPLELTAGNSGEVFFAFWLWCEVGRPHDVRLKRFIADFRSVVLNATEKPIEVAAGSRREPRRKLGPGESINVLELSNVQPRHILKLRVYPEVGIDRGL